MATDFELQVLDKLGEIQAQGMATATKLESLEDRLFNGGSGVVQTLQNDIQEIKDDRANDKKWDKIHNIVHYSSIPLLGVIHAIMRKLGVNI